MMNVSQASPIQNVNNMDYQKALNPEHSIVVEACAGSGKTWLLVSRIIRLLLNGTRPGDILAITFTRKAAQEMQVRLRQWLYDLSAQDEAFVRDFLRERHVPEQELDALIPRARLLYQQFLQAEPEITISTFHGWFIQLLQRAPMNSGLAGNTQLLEQTFQMLQQAWQQLLNQLEQQPDSETATTMLSLFEQIGLHNTYQLLMAFIHKRTDWWSYTSDCDNPVDETLIRLSEQLDLGSVDSDPRAGLMLHPQFINDVREFSTLLSASAAQRKKQQQIMDILESEHDASARYDALWQIFFTKQNKPRSLKPNKGQDADLFYEHLDRVVQTLQQTDAQIRACELHQLNQQALICGHALLNHYQQLKQQQHYLDFSDLEWHVFKLLQFSEHAEFMMCKLDSRYRHVLLDEFQDTSPLQWQIMQCWFTAAHEADSQPVVFIVGDPKQSIYRFRGADVRIFDLARQYLQQHFQATHLMQNITRRNAATILQVVNNVFTQQPDYHGFETHQAFDPALPGYIEQLPLGCYQSEPDTESPSPTLRNPLFEALPEENESHRSLEAQQLAQKISEITHQWALTADHPIQYRDIMILVRRRSHLITYEQALRQQHIPYLTSRRGGLLETLEARDLQNLLDFLMSPQDELAFMQTLRMPIFNCSDKELLYLFEQKKHHNCSGWRCLIQPDPDLVLPEALKYAADLLRQWMHDAATLPVHDLLDKIYFESNLILCYQQQVPAVMRDTVTANLQAFLEISLKVDAGRFPGLSTFLRQLKQLSQMDSNEAPDEGSVSQSGNAVRIYTIHESKGLEAPVVFIIDSNNLRQPADTYDVLCDWPAESAMPTHFSLYGNSQSRCQHLQCLYDQKQALSAREDMNLLYVAMTRARQILFISGNGELQTDSWYGKIEQAWPQDRTDDNWLRSEHVTNSSQADHPSSADTNESLALPPEPVGQRKESLTQAQQYGIWLHSLMEHLIQHNDPGLCLQQMTHIPAPQLPGLLKQAEKLINNPELQRFFNPEQYLSASNELSMIDPQGQLKRIDRLVEYDEEIWILDYKSSYTMTSEHDYYEQLRHYRRAMAEIYPDKPIYCALILGNGELSPVD